MVREDRKSRRRKRKFFQCIEHAVGIKAGGAQISSERDAYALAAELRQSADLTDIDEIAFIDVPARYGLRHYLEVDVEEVVSMSTAREKDGYSAPESICAEFDVPESRLWIGRTRRLDEIKASFEACGRTLQSVGTLRKWTIFRDAMTR